jgi:chromate transporter
MISLRSLFVKILKLGATAYGGPGMISIIKETSVNKYGWVKEGEFMGGLALCQLIPGATMVQIVTYVGYRVRGIWGALVSAVAFVLPAFIAILFLSALYFKMQNLAFIQALFKGLGAIVVAIILNACIAFGKSVFKDRKIVLISVLSFIAFFYRWNFLLVFVLAAVAGLLLHPRQSETKKNPSPEGVPRDAGEIRGRFILISLVVFIAVILVICYFVDPRLPTLFVSLSKIGALAFGGGFTGIPLIQYEMVEKFQWLTTKEFLDGIALGQITPGPVLITSTFIGYKVAGLLGATMATLGMFSSSFLILMLVIPYHDRLRGSARVRMMEQGVLGAFIGMLGLVLFNFGRTSLVDLPTLLMAAAAFFALHKKVSLPYILLAGGVLSVLLFHLLT